ncbi:MAG: hypothetical protein ACYDEE_10800 [Ignavibacteriaceae bacterium]
MSRYFYDKFHSVSFKTCLPVETVAQLQNVILTGGRNPILDSFETSLYVRD